MRSRTGSPNISVVFAVDTFSMNQYRRGTATKARKTRKGQLVSNWKSSPSDPSSRARSWVSSWASNAMSSASISLRSNRQNLHDIPAFYQVREGNFWLAVVDGRVVGTISLLDIGNNQGALRKMFVHPELRGSERRTAKRLLETLLDWARDRQVREIFLGTTSKFLAAHRFYARNGFSEVPRSALPSAFPIMTVDTRFFYRRVA